MAPTLTAASSCLEYPESGLSPDFRCARCEYTNNTMKGLGQLVMMMLRTSKVDVIIDSENENKEETIFLTASGRKQQ